MQPSRELSESTSRIDYIATSTGIAVVDIAWSRQPDRFWVHTCSLDHPKALPTYERTGFVIYDRVTRRIRDPRPLTLNI